MIDIARLGVAAILLHYSSIINTYHASVLQCQMTGSCLCAAVARAVQLSSCAANAQITNPCDSAGAVPATAMPRLITVP